MSQHFQDSFSISFVRPSLWRIWHDLSMETKEYLEVQGGYVISRARIYLENFQCHVRAKALRSSQCTSTAPRWIQKHMSCPEEFAVNIHINIHMLFAFVCHLTGERTNYILAQPMGRDCGGPRKAKHRAQQCLNSPSKKQFFWAPINNLLRNPRSTCMFLDQFGGKAGRAQSTRVVPRQHLVSSFCGTKERQRDQVKRSMNIHGHLQSLTR